MWVTLPDVMAFRYAEFTWGFGYLSHLPKLLGDARFLVSQFNRAIVSVTLPRQILNLNLHDPIAITPLRSSSSLVGYSSSSNQTTRSGLLRCATRSQWLEQNEKSNGLNEVKPEV